jgi:AraC-like DNA-binding protein
MPLTLRGLDPARLERSCTCDRIRAGQGGPGLERVAVRLTGAGFAPHRHDTYAIGVTTAGVQTFRYRGRRRICLPGQLHVLHPDELHDGGPGTADGFAYRIAYLDPALVHGALDGRPLPFVAEPVHDPAPATRELMRLLCEIDDPLDELAQHDAVIAVTGALTALAGHPGGGGPIDLDAVAGVREYLKAHARQPISAATLERLSGLDRYTLARQFRRAFGTSPDRYRTMRRLDLARSAIAAGTPLAAAAVEAGFADQSHMTRQFRRAFGMTPGRWATVSRGRS